MGSFEQNVQELVELPPSLKELPIVLLRDSKKSGKQKEFKVDGAKIRNALLWLIENNPYYKFIRINETNLKQYPENGGIITDVRTIEIESNDKEKEQSEWNPNL